MNNDNIELHLYLWLDRKWKYKREAKISTSQREQYRGTVHLFIGMGHSSCKITSMPFTFANDFKVVHRGLNNLFPFKSVPFFAVMPKLPCV
jgi:viroplasmin and RNaseH domain-containing protein